MSSTTHAQPVAMLQLDAVAYPPADVTSLRARKEPYRSDGEPPCWTEVPFESLQPHEKFRVKDPMDNEKGVTFEAVDAPFSHYDGYRATLSVRYILPAPILSLVP